MNILKDKKILENWNYSEVLTNGDIKNYTGTSGFSYAACPETLTFDLEKVTTLKCIRFLLWDHLGSNNTVRSERKYKYRLLSSIDSQHWHVHFDTGKEGYNGWQQFVFEKGIEVQFIRLHAISNTANNGFHLVEFQAFENNPPGIDSEIILERYFSNNGHEIEIGDGLPLTQKMNYLTNSLERVLNENTIINPKPFNEIISKFRTQARNIHSLEKSFDSIRREIINPVQNELKEGKRLGQFSVWGFYVGFAGILTSIFAILNGIFKWI